MIPKIGQRWIFSWNESDRFLAEVIGAISPYVWKWKIVQIFNGENINRVGDEIDNALSECWRYLEDQDRPI